MPRSKDQQATDDKEQQEEWQGPPGSPLGGGQLPTPTGSLSRFPTFEDWGMPCYHWEMMPWMYYPFPGTAPAWDTPAATDAAAKASAKKEKKAPKAASKQNVRLHVKNLDETLTSEALSAIFASHGTVKKGEVKTDKDGKSKGFGQVTMSTREGAEKAIAELNGTKQGEKEMSVVMAPEVDKTKDKGNGSSDKPKGKGKDKAQSKEKEYPEWMTMMGPEEIMANLKNNVWTKAQTEEGSLELQHALDSAELLDVQKVELAKELEGNVSVASKHKWANYMIQKCFEKFKPLDIQFMVKELPPDSAKVLAKHQFGGRIVQRMLEHCSATQTQAFVEQLLDPVEAAVEISTNEFGNFVMKILLETWRDTPKHYQERLMQILVDHASEVGTGKGGYGAAVLGKALEEQSEWREILSNALLSQLDRFAEMGCSFYCNAYGNGNTTAKLALKYADPHMSESALLELPDMVEPFAEEGIRGRYGRNLATYLKKPASKIIRARQAV